jgi:glycosyltransferase involved in cell wall biosynthesis
VDRYATHIVGCGEGAMDAAWRSDWRHDPRCRVIYNSVDPARFADDVDRDGVRRDLGVPAAARLFLHVGNLVAPKNHPRLIEIFAAIHRVDPGAWLVLAGAGTNEPGGEVARQAARLGVSRWVLALGRRSDVPRLIEAADVLLLPSVLEGLPGVVLEACAVGVPVLATDLPGVREVAARLSLVRCLGLSASDQRWAQEALSLPREAERLQLREAAAEAFRASVFHIDQAVDAHRELWTRPVAREAPRCS